MGEPTLWAKMALVEPIPTLGNLRKSWPEKHTTDHPLRITGAVAIALESALYPAESRYVANTRRGFQTPSSPTMNSHGPKLSGPYDATLKTALRMAGGPNDWSDGRNSERPRLDKSGPKGNRLLKNEYWSRYHEGNSSRVDSSR